jgi:hypothetical protein
VVIWYIFPVFGILYKEKSGNPADKVEYISTFCTLLEASDLPIEGLSLIGRLPDPLVKSCRVIGPYFPPKRSRDKEYERFKVANSAAEPRTNFPDIISLFICRSSGSLVSAMFADFEH